MLRLVVGSDGLPRDVSVTRTLGHGLDAKAIEAVKRWKFKPAMMDGKPIAVEVSVQVAFHLWVGPVVGGSPVQLAPKLNTSDNGPHFTPEQLATLATQWSTKAAYTPEQLAELRAKCALYVDTKVELLESKKAPLPPHECAGVLAWMRSLRVEVLYMLGNPPQ